MTKNTLKWRLSKLPTPGEIRELVKDKIITQEEARDILFKKGEEVDKVETDEMSALREEIKFLKGLVDRLAQKDYTRLVEVIKRVEVPVIRPWYKPYEVWISATDQTMDSLGDSSACQAFNSIT